MHFLDILEEAQDYLSVLHVTSYSNKALPHIIGFNVARNIIHANIIASLLAAGTGLYSVIHVDFDRGNDIIKKDTIRMGVIRL